MTHAPLTPDPRRELRDRIARALANADGLELGETQSFPFLHEGQVPGYRRRAEAVLAVLEAERDSLGREVDRLRKDWVEMRTRAEQAEELQRIAHDTSNKSEAERARAVRRAEKAEALLLHFTAEAHRRKWTYDRGLNNDGVPIKSEAFGALHRLGEEMRVELEELRRLAGEAPEAKENP